MNAERDNLKKLLEQFRDELSSQIRGIDKKQEKLDKAVSQLLGQTTLTGEIPASTVPAQRLLELFAESLNKVQQDIAAAPGTTKFALGSFRPNVKATLTFDKEGQLLLNLPQPGDPTPPDVLSNIAFEVLPLPWEPSVAADEVLVPNLVGSSLEPAKSKLAEVGLVLGEVAKEPTDVASDVVLEQEPAAGLVVLKASTINVTISEQAFVDVPLIVGLHVDDAKTVLENAGLGHKVRSEIEGDQPAGGVLQQEPAAGERVRRGTVIVIDISKGPLIQVPHIVGKSLDEAKRLISKSDLVVGRITERESEAEPRTVVQQDPPGGLLVAKKTGIDSTVSKGLLVEVPGVVGLQDRGAKKVVESVGLIPEIRTEVGSKRPEGEVLRQEPSPGTRVSKHSKVMFDVSKGAESKEDLVEVPEVVGIRIDRAEEILGRSQLKSRIEKRLRSERPANEVVKQEPKPGELVKINSIVKLHLSREQPTTTA